MASSIKIRARKKKDVVDFKALIQHPMETGLRKNANTGKTIPAHFIQEVRVESNGDTVMTAYWSGVVSKNPYVSFKYAGKKGDTVTLSWSDNQGGTDTASATVR